jgi:hypothetical protein
MLSPRKRRRNQNQNQPKMTMTHGLDTQNGFTDLCDASLDELLSARAHAWRSFFSNFENHNGFGQRYRDNRFIPYAQKRREEAEYRERIRRDLGIDEIEAEIISRGVDPKDKNFRRVRASWSYLPAIERERMARA